jgi:serine/threonine protein kinase
MFHEGQKIGSYKLLTKIGKGGFGEVWLAEKRSELVTKKVAVKLPLEDQIDLETIKQEAELWEQASGHANVLPIIDADIIDGQVLIVSEYAEGGSLHDKLRREGKLSIKQAVEMTIGILNGLEFLHNKRIIHRDIKPQNILLQGDTPRLADFGISRAMQTVAISSTIIGTDSYMSPETFEGKRSVQTDIWAVGVVLYQLLKGSLPFPQEHPSERMFAIIQKDFEPLSDEVPFNLQQIIKKALAKLPENRSASVSEMRDELKNFLTVINATTKPFVKRELPLTEKQTAKIEEPEIITEIRHLSPSFYSETSEKPKRKGFYLTVIVAVFMLGFSSMAMIYFWSNSSKIGVEKNVDANSVLANSSDSNSSLSNTNSDLTNSNVSTNIVKNNKLATVTKVPTPKKDINENTTLSRHPTPKITPSPNDKIKQTSPKTTRMCRINPSVPAGNWDAAHDCISCTSEFAIPNSRCP